MCRSGICWRLAVLLEQGQLKIPRPLKETETLVRELTEIEVRQGAGGRVTMGAEGEGPAR